MPTPTTLSQEALPFDPYLEAFPVDSDRQC